MRLYLVPPGELAKKRGLTPAQLLPRGLRGFYYDDEEGLHPPSLVHDDPLLNFSNMGSFPRRSPLIRWKGKLEAPQTGYYAFAVSTWCQASLFLDGKERINAFEGAESCRCFLAAGAHPIEVIFENPGGKDAWDLDLYWQKPGAREQVIIPNEAFGVLR
jgi:hypothetical protein